MACGEGLVAWTPAEVDCGESAAHNTQTPTRGRRVTPCQYGHRPKLGPSGSLGQQNHSIRHTTHAPSLVGLVGLPGAPVGLHTKSTTASGHASAAAAAVCSCSCWVCQDKPHQCHPLWPLYLCSQFQPAGQVPEVSKRAARASRLWTDGRTERQQAGGVQ